ncbi:MAG: 4Fe-4S dicluster domain-containing protein [Bacteroidetes bacterium]|nr:4Fe-4S dicluster domain-containing protein [Bacteroidota bacterium]
MAIKITEECINCGACEPECPNHAIYEGSAKWRYADGTKVTGNYTGKNSGLTQDAGQENDAISNDLYFIVPDKCTECTGFHDEPQCAAVCPVDCCLPDANFTETKEELAAKKASLHLE